MQTVEKSVYQLEEEIEDTEEKILDVEKSLYREEQKEEEHLENDLSKLENAEEDIKNSIKYFADIVNFLHNQAQFREAVPDYESPFGNGSHEGKPNIDWNLLHQDLQDVMKNLKELKFILKDIENVERVREDTEKEIERLAEEIEKLEEEESNLEKIVYILKRPPKPPQMGRKGVPKDRRDEVIEETEEVKKKLRKLGNNLTGLRKDANNVKGDEIQLLERIHNDIGDTFRGMKGATNIEKVQDALNHNTSSADLVSSLGPNRGMSKQVSADLSRVSDIASNVLREISDIQEAAE